MLIGHISTEILILFLNHINKEEKFMNERLKEIQDKIEDTQADLDDMDHERYTELEMRSLVRYWERLKDIEKELLNENEVSNG